ncbi:hypothetical protein BSLG_009976 [Batrachochytrium salamandrivorans]|nr:hypothetical protein BSLG_009976 [Batrachochytrium salamandrivorans]
MSRLRCSVSTPFADICRLCSCRGLRPKDCYHSSKHPQVKNSTEPLTPSQVKILINASKQKKDIPICQRCHNLKHHNYSQVPASFHTNHSQFKSLKTHVGGLVVLIVDIYDLPCTLLSNLRDLVGIKNVIVAINKSDLIPRLEDPRIYVDWVRRRIQGGARTVSIVPISARLGTGIDDLISAIVHNRKPNEDIYMMGVTNVGKSAVINQMITHAGHDAFLTTSNFAGTTLSPIPVPLSSFGPLFFPNYVGDISDPDHDIYKDKGRMIDTAGAYNYQQLTHFLDSSEFQLVVPKHPIKPRKILLKPGYSVWFGALVRFEVIETKVASHFWYYGCNDFPIHACKESKVRSLWEEHAGVSKDLLTPPFGKDRINLLPPFSVALESRYKGGLKEGVRIWLGGLGWIVLYGQVHFRMWTPGGVGIHMDTDSSPTNARKIVL